MPFEFQPTALSGITLITPKYFGDDRGFFAECFKLSDFTEQGLDGHFVQLNHSRSGKNVLRGLHFQRPPFAQGKLLRCIRGCVWDVAVDIRGDSPTFGQWFGTEISRENRMMIYISPGFAHGFCVLSDEAEITYHVTGAEYCPDAEAGIHWNDPDLGISWPVSEPILSAKDRTLPTLQNIVLPEQW
ncbi:MAG: dTDP-4-dehydrorhamnose 3,5-epimerase [Lentisphaeria bacterium]|nr:dTDP-4-dehydrorhamnose 3,5-epimerase [Lentisphaeria bacterium]